MSRSTAPDVVVQRLPLYLRNLEHMLASGQAITSSAELAASVGVSPAQLRKDLSLFGGFGKQGLGYSTAYLREQLRRILHVTQTWSVALVGAGALGHAIVNYRAFERDSFRIAAVFDSDRAKLGRPIGHLLVQPIEAMQRILATEKVSIGIVAVPPEVAQEVASQLVACGVRAILNYAPVNLALPPGVHVSHIDPVANLQSLTYYLE